MVWLSRFWLGRVAALAGPVALAGLIALAEPAGAVADDRCERLFVPEGYDVTCSLEGGTGSTTGVLTVRPAEGSFASLSELTIRPVAEPIADPEAWLREQLTLDLSRFDAALDDLLHGPDSPVADSPMVDELETWRGLLHSVAGWPLTGCEDPERQVVGDRWQMDCEWQLGPFRQYAALRLLTRDGMRYAVNIRAMNEHRLRNLVAIANSF